MKKTKKTATNNRYIIGLITGLLIGTFVWKIFPILNSRLEALESVSKSNYEAKEEDAVIKEVLPEKYDLGISFGDAIVKLVDNGAIDKEAFIKLYEGRQDLTPEQIRLLEVESNETIVITEENANLLLNLLWPLGVANKTSVLSDGPMGTQYKDKVGSFASTGGWTLGKEEGGKLFNRFAIINLSPEEEARVTEISQNIFRPCCGNSTYFPDCNHGAAMLAFIELAVAQGMPTDEIYQKALVLNSFWFPQTYVKLATYFGELKDTPWDEVDPKKVLGSQYSSGQGYAAISKELEANNLVPSVSGGGSCGV